MDIRKLDIFCKVVALKSFTRTAEAVRLSQPTVSEHIRNLEEELNQKLIDRLGREAVPTPAGRILYDYASQILQIHQEAVEAVEKYSGRLAGKMIIGCSTIPGTYILPELISRFRKIHPAIKMTLRVNSSRIIAEQVMTGALGLGVVGARWGESGLHWTKVFVDELILAVPPHHPWADQKCIPLERIVTEPCIMREPDSGTRRVIAQFLKANGLREADLQDVAEIGSTAAVKEAVKRGIGISIVSKRSILDSVTCRLIAAVSFDGLQMERPFYLIHRKNKALSPVVAAFRDYLLAQTDND
jgi:DNA-binding transcriptional LysR family regulator